MMSVILGSINVLCLFVLALYAIRQYLFSIITFKHKIVDNYQPAIPNHNVSVLIPARNEEKVIGRLLGCLMKTEYPQHKLEIIVLNDASTDKTSQIAHEWASRYPNIKVIDRKTGGIGKGDVMNQGMAESKGDTIFVFDADYTPAPDTIPKLLRWFSDPKVGLVQGRIHVVNKDENTLTKTVYAERSGGFLCDLYARDLLHVSNQYGGTVGGFRRSLIEKVGPWEPRQFTEDTDLTCRTLLAGYKVKYDATADSGEEAPNNLSVYYKQRYRWIRGHTVCGLKYTKKILTSPFLSLREKIEGAMWINLNCVPFFVTLGLFCWLTHIFVLPVSFMLPSPLSYIYLIATAGGLVSMTFAGLSKCKSVGKYFKYVVLMVLNSYPMCFAVTLKAYFDILFNRPLKWVKTERSGIMT
jgi:cellulose synthase/poly-beta-1,6-N-acetylglucosamine synthase-like glycosyltransferase